MMGDNDMNRIVRASVFAVVAFVWAQLGSALAQTYDQFVTFTERRGGLIVNSYTHSSYSEWVINPTGTDKIDLAWCNPANCIPDSIEEFEIKRNCADGQSYVFVNAYRDDVAVTRSPITTTRAVLVDLGTQQETDITNVCGAAGQPYALYSQSFA